MKLNSQKSLSATKHLVMRRRNWTARRFSISFLWMMTGLLMSFNERQLVDSWPFFNGFEDSSRALAALAPRLDQIQPLNLPAQSQLLIPVGHHHLHHQQQPKSQPQPQPQLQQPQQQEPQQQEPQQQPQQPQQASFIYEPRAADGASGGSTAIKLMSDLMNSASSSPVLELKDEDQQKDSSPSSSANHIERSASISAESSSPIQQQQQVSSEDLPPTSSISLPSIGKILEVVQNSTNNNNSANSLETSSTRTEKLANVALNILRPRKQDAKQQLSYTEQQIINQHARVHLTGHSHQRLLPTKQRDNKLANTFLSSDSFSSGSSGGRDSPLNSFFGNLKSGISSRSSIVKAISDNKLARTLSTLGKSISGNKYVAGAAAASAIAALGLTMSKFLSPYLFAGGFSKLGDGSMTSSSFLNPSYVNPNRANSFPPISTPDGMFSSSSSLFKSQLSPYSESDLTPLDSQPSSSSYNQQLGSFNGGSSGSQDQLYYTYTPKKPAKLSETSNFDVNNLFADNYKYPKEGDSILSSSSSQPDLSGYPLTGNDYSTVNADTQFGASDGFYPSSYQPRLTSTASFDSPMAATTSNYKYAYPPIGSTSRRSGAMTIKLDEVTRAKLNQLLKQQPLFTYVPKSINDFSSYEFPQYQRTFIVPSTVNTASGDSSSDYSTGSSNMMKASRMELSRPLNLPGERPFVSELTYSSPRVVSTQSVPKIISQPSYIILRPNKATKSPLTMTLNESDSGQRSAKQLNTEQSATSGLLKQHQSSGSAWRSLDSMETQSSIPQKQHTSRPATSSTVTNNKQSNNNNNVSAKSAEPQQSSSVTDQQVSTKAPSSLFNGQQVSGNNSRALLLRNSRTPTDGVLKIQPSSGVARKSSLPQPIEVVGDQQQQQQQQRPELKSVNSYLSTSHQVNYSGEGSKQQSWQLGASGGSGAVMKQRTTTNDTPMKMMHVDSKSNSKINLIQLNNEENDVAPDEEHTPANKNIIKLIEVHAAQSGKQLSPISSSDGKLTASYPNDAALVIMSQPKGLKGSSTSLLVTEKTRHRHNEDAEYNSNSGSAEEIVGQPKQQQAQDGKSFNNHMTTEKSPNENSDGPQRGFGGLDNGDS